MKPERRQQIKRLIDDLMEARVRDRYKAVDLKLFDADDILSALRDLWAEVGRLETEAENGPDDNEMKVYL